MRIEQTKGKYVCIRNGCDKCELRTFIGMRDCVTFAEHLLNYKLPMNQCRYDGGEWICFLRAHGLAFCAFIRSVLVKWIHQNIIIVDLLLKVRNACHIFPFLWNSFLYRSFSAFYSRNYVGWTPNVVALARITKVTQTARAKILIFCYVRSTFHRFW